MPPGFREFDIQVNKWRKCVSVVIRVPIFCCANVIMLSNLSLFLLDESFSSVTLVSSSNKLSVVGNDDVVVDNVDDIVVVDDEEERREAIGSKVLGSPFHSLKSKSGLERGRDSEEEEREVDSEGIKEGERARELRTLAGESMPR